MPDPLPHELNHHHHQQTQRPSSSSAPPPSPPPQVVREPEDEDERLSKSEFLTKPEVMKRRARFLKKLSRIYLDYYWALMEELKVKHREYYWEYGKSPFLEDDENNDNNNNYGNAVIRGDNGEANFQVNAENYRNFGGGSANRCGVHGCKSKAMALTKFCQMHILSDSKQKLYKPCNYTIKRSQTGPILCGKPILRSTMPSYCALHFQKAEKHVARALKKAGLNASSTSKLAPKFHVIVAEYVRQIQGRRRAAQKAALENAEIQEEDISC